MKRAGKPKGDEKGVTGTNTVGGGRLKKYEGNQKTVILQKFWKNWGRKRKNCRKSQKV